MVAVIDGVVKLYSYRHFHSVFVRMVLSDHDKRNETGIGSSIFCKRIRLGIAESGKAGIWHDGNMDVIHGIALVKIQAVAVLGFFFILQKTGIKIRKIFCIKGFLMGKKVIRVLSENGIMGMHLIPVPDRVIYPGKAEITVFIYRFRNAVTDGRIKLSPFLM